MIAPEIPTSDVTESKIPLPVADGPSSDRLVERDPEKRTTPDSIGSAEEVEAVQQYPPARSVILIMLSLYLVMFLVALVSVAKRRPHDCPVTHTEMSLGC